MKNLFFLFLFLPGILVAQKKAPYKSSIIAAPCSEPGTVPSKAIPVCGTTVFTQNAVTDCQGPDIAQTLCPDQYTSGHSYWYKFTCFASGSLDFLITPNLLSDDYDWVLFDATGHNPDDVFTDPTMVISINGAFPTGITGCGATGLNNFECFSSAELINRPENILVGHNFLLMVTNYTNSGAGYGLTFGGTAVISDGVLPGISQVEGGCTKLKVFFTTDIKCTSVTLTGSEFTISPGVHTITGITSNCALSFLTITDLTINLLSPLAPGNYTLTVNKGTDNNTLNNVCDNEMPIGTNISFTVQQPVGNFIPPPETCFGSVTNFTSTSDPLPGNTVAEWHWDFGDPASGGSNISTLQNPSHIFTATGTFTVRHWIVNSVGCNSDTSSQTVTIIPLHNIALNTGNPNQTVCINNAIIPFTLTISGGALGITPALNLPAGVTATLAGNTVTLSGTPTVAGTFNYTLTTTGNSCAPVNFTGTITVTGDATLARTSAAGTDAQELCRNSAITDITYIFGGSASGATVTGLPPGVGWLVTGNIITISGSPTVALPAAYNYTVSTLGPCIKPSMTGTILVNELPTAAFSYTAPSCETRIIGFTDGSTANIGVLDLWTWDFGDGPPTSSLQNPTHVYAAAGAYTVTLAVRNDKGCISNPIASTIINIDNRPQAGFIIPEVCLNDTYAQFTDTSKLINAAIDRWDWDFGDPGSGPLNVSGLQNPTHSYSAVGSYNVRLIAWNSIKGCRDTITQSIFVNGSFPAANFNVNNPAMLCANDSVGIVEASTVFPGNITRIEIYWDNANFPAVFQTDNNPFNGKIYRHLYPNFQSPLTNVFTIRYRAYSGGVCVNDKLDDITVNAAPLVQFNNMPNSCLLVPPFQITQASEIGAVPGTGVYSGPGVSPGGVFDPQIAGVGTHIIMYTFTSTAAGCVDSKSNTITVLDTAHAAFSFVSPSCEQLPTSFTDLSTAPASVTLTNTVWDFGDLSPLENHAPGTTFGHLFPGPGTYTVTMYNESTVGCRSTVVSKQVTIDPNHSITLTSGNSIQTLCINNAITPIVYTLAGGATGATVLNLPPGLGYTVTGTTLTISGTPTSTLNSPYNFSIQTTGNTCVLAQASGSITVDADHTITFSSGNTTQSVCVNTPIDPIVYTIGGGASSVSIANLPPGIVFTVTGNTVTISGIPTTTAGGPLFLYTIQTTGNGCVKASAAGEIRVNPYPVSNFIIDKPAYCLPNAIVNFTNGSTMPDGSQMTYAWEFGELSSGLNNFSTLVHPSHWYATTGPFDVKLIARSMAVLNGNIIGCLHDTIIKISSIHPQPIAAFAQSQPTACLGDVVGFADNSNPMDGAANAWFWDMGDGVQKDVPTFSYTYTDTLEYNIRFYMGNSFGCNSDTINRLFKVYPNPTIYAGEDRTVLQGGRVILAPVATGVELQYLWTPNLYFLNGNNGIKNPTASNIQDDITYRITVTARGGCKRSDDIYIKILKPPVIPNTFTPNSDGINDKWLISYLNDYPDCKVEVFTRSGQLVFRSEKGYPVPWDGTRNGKPLPFDTYYYIIEPGFGRDPVTGYITLVK
ncbi:MAG: PKD domain-containing protein [Ferruginibacter sp.]